MSRLEYLPVVDSTNLWCKQHQQQLEDGDAVYSQCQTAGRGRLGRSWQNAPGSALYYSVFLKGSMADRASLPLAASLAVSRALWQEFGARTQIKWPNDLLLGGKKLVGILCEGVSGGIVCGIGVNLTQSRDFWHKAQLPYATSLLAEGIDPGADGARRLAQTLSDQLGPKGMLEGFRAEGFSVLQKEYKQACVNIGRKVQFEGGEGLVRDVDSKGQLVVEEIEKGEKRVFTGEVHVGGIYGQISF